MGHRSVPGFNNINYIIVCPKKFNLLGYNRVNGFDPDLPPAKMHSASPNIDSKYLRIFYTENIHRLHAKLYSKIAGYTSYLEYIDAAEKNYIALSICKIKGERRKYKAEYSTIIDQLNGSTSDFNYIISKLSQYYTLTRHEKIKALSMLTSNVGDLMKDPSVKCAIFYVKNILKKNKCRMIDGQHIKNVIKEVNRQTNKIQYNDYLNKFSM